MTNSAPAVQSNEQPAETGTPSSNLILRNDTILGVCEGIGQDFGFSANWLRIPLAGMVLISPIWAFGIYFALGIAVLLSRLIFPARRQLAARQGAAEAHLHNAANETNEEMLAA